MRHGAALQPVHGPSQPPPPPPTTWKPGGWLTNCPPRHPARSEEWERRTAALRGLLRERDGEVAQLQGLLERSQRALAGREQEAAALERRIAELEGRIEALLRQLEGAQAAAAAGARGEPAAA